MRVLAGTRYISGYINRKDNKLEGKYKEEVMHMK